MFDDLYEFFFYEIPIIVFEWLERQAELNMARPAWVPILWMEETVQFLKVTNNKWYRAVDVWCSSVIEGYIVEFYVEAGESFTIAERKFFAGPRGRYIFLLSMWIKMFLTEKGLMSVENKTMVG